jgi:superfamily II DNA or RNA helicase
MVGRGLRTADGKTECLILDHSDNHTRLGFVTDINYDTLDDGKARTKAKPKKAEALPRKMPPVQLPEATEDADVPRLRLHAEVEMRCRHR